MAIGRQPPVLDWEVTGNGPGRAFFNFFPESQGTHGGYRGRIRRFVVVTPTGSTATSATFHFLDHKVPGSTGGVVTDPATIEAHKKPVETAAVPLSAGTDADLDTPITAEPAFKGSLVLIANVTAAAGAWTIRGTVELEM